MTISSPSAEFRAARDLLLSSAQDPERAHREFAWPDLGPHFNWAVDWFDEIALGNDKLALWVVDESGDEWRITYDQMRLRSNRVANWLISLGVKRGDFVMLMIDNRVELWETMLAIMKVGAVILPTSVVLGTRDVKDRIDRAHVRVVIADSNDAEKFDALDDDLIRIVVGSGREGWEPYADADAFGEAPVGVVVDSGDPAIVYFTSGTTSRPKMVVHTQLSYPEGHLSTMYWIGVRPGDVHMTISAPGWGKHAWSCFFAPWIAEATVFIFNYARFDARELVAQLDRAQVNTFCAPPTVWRMLIQADIEHKPGNLREVLSAGEPLNPEVIATIERWWGLQIRDGYGQTELTAVIGNSPGVRLKPGSMGRALPGVEIVLVDPVTGIEGDNGEICLPLTPRRPLNLMDGYLGEPDRTAKAEAGGYYHTSDVARRDSDGFLTFIGRTDDVFKASDFKISPFEVESALIEHPAVVEAAVVGAPDPVRLNAVKAYVSLASGWEDSAETAKQILAFARNRLPAYMRVRRLEVFELPKTASGKIRRVELREREIDLKDSGRIVTEYRDSDFNLRATS